MNKTNKTKNKIITFRRRAVITSLIVVILAFGGFYLLQRLRNEGQTTENTQATADDDYINLDPATEEDKKAAERNKQDILENQQTNRPAGDKYEVVPVITFAGERDGSIEVRSYVSEVYESDGICTITFTKGSEKISRDVEGMKDATYTRCDRVVVPREDFTAGTWNLVVSYTSPSAEGSSKTQEILVE